MKRLIIISLLLLLSNFLIAQSKHALIIGNSNYKQMPLKNPKNDAYDLSASLKSYGFDVITKINLNQKAMEDAIRKFKSSIKAGDVALFYFSGHGTQVNGLNYLIPVNESISNELDVKYHCVEAGFVLDHMEEAQAGTNIIILDACRNNPFKGQRSSSRGFAYMSAPTGSIIAYSTAPGSVAQDGDGRNSPFTKNLIIKMKTPGMKIEEVFKEVRKEVANETGQQQIPWESSSLMRDFYFIEPTISDNKMDIIEVQPIINKLDNKQSVNEDEREKFEYESYTDIRDNQVYKSIQIDKHIWMAENLNFITSNSYCYEEQDSNCGTYGRYYNWKEAKEVCPEGWHLPSMTEFELLKQYSEKEGFIDELMSEEDWGNTDITLTNKTNVAGFNAIPSGAFFGKKFGWNFAHEKACFWTSTGISKDNAYSFWISNNKTSEINDIEIKKVALSVRCIKDK